MDYQAEYRVKLRTPEEAVRVVKSGDWIDYGTALSMPVLLDRALAGRRDELMDVKIRGNLLFGPVEVAECDPTKEHFVYNSWHCSAYERTLCDRGLCYFIPTIFRNLVAYYRHFLDVNVAILAMLSRRRSPGRCCWMPSNSVWPFCRTSPGDFRRCPASSSMSTQE